MEINAHPHHIHPDHAIIINDVKHMLASNYTSLLTHIDSHIDDNRRHISIEDRDRWDNKADKVSLYDLEMRLASKADYVDLTDLKETVGQIKTIVNGNNGTNGTNGSSAVTERELEYILQGKDYATKSDLSEYLKRSDLLAYDYATKEWCDSRFVKLSDYSTTIPDVVKQYVDNKVANSGSGNAGGSNSGSGNTGDGGSQSSYDDTQVRQLIAQVQEDLNNIISRERDSIKGIVHEVITEGNDWLSRLQNGETLPESMSWVTDLEAFVLKVAHKNEDGSTVTWSTFYQDYNQLKQTVSQLGLLYDENGDTINYEVLQSMVRTAVENDTAIAELKARYALTETDETVLKWLSAGFHTEASANKSVAQVFATAEDVAANETAIAALNTKVDQIDSDYASYSSVAELATRVTNLEGTSGTSSGFVTQSNIGSSIAAMFATNDVDAATGKDAIDDAISGKVDTAYILTQINADGSTNAVISADRIDIDGLVDKLRVNSLFAQTITQQIEGLGSAEYDLRDSSGQSLVNITAAYYNSASAYGQITVHGSLGETTTLNGRSLYIDDSRGDSITFTGGTMSFDGTNGSVTIASTGLVNAGRYATDGELGVVDRTFTTADGKTVTVKGGIITSIS